MKKIIVIFLMLIFVSFVSAYRAGDTITYRVVCHYNNGSVDTGCTKPVNERIYFPDGTVKVANNLSEIDETNAPGLWAGNFTIPGGTDEGTIGIYINLLNTNKTQAATVLSYSVEKLATETNITTIMKNATAAQSDVVTILANTITLSTEHSTLESGIQTNATDIKLNATAAQSDISTILSNTITLSSEHTSLETGIQNNATDIKDNISNVANDIKINSSALAIVIMQNITASMEEIKVNLTTTDFAANVWAYAGTIVSNILSQFPTLANIQDNTTAILVNTTADMDDITTSISSSDESSIGYQCARQLRNQNATVYYNYNESDFTLMKVTYNYKSVTVFVDEN